MWRYIAAKATGTSHQRADLSCQDRFACIQVRENNFVFALADGAGSAAKGDRGAELVVQTAIRVISSQLILEKIDLKKLICEVADEARKVIQSTAQEHSIETREFASTFLVVIIRPNGGAAAQIGDGVITVRDGEDAWCWVFWPQHGEFVNTTRFLTDDDAMKHLQIELLPPTVNDVILLTDGLERLALDLAAKKPHDPFFTGLITPLLLEEGIGEIADLSLQLESFLCSERIVARTDDDVSLIVATRRPQIPKI